MLWPTSPPNHPHMDTASTMLTPNLHPPLAMASLRPISAGRTGWGSPHSSRVCLVVASAPSSCFLVTSSRSSSRTKGCARSVIVWITTSHKFSKISALFCSKLFLRKWIVLICNSLPAFPLFRTKHFCNSTTWVPIFPPVHLQFSNPRALWFPPVQ